MASFGRRPTKNAGSAGADLHSAPAPTPSSPSGPRATGGESEGYRKLKEEIAERERFAREYEEKVEQEEKQEKHRRKDSQEETSSRQDRSHGSKANPCVFLEVEVSGPELLGRKGKVEASGRLEFELFADAVPRTAENFRCLCTGEKGRDLRFEGSIFHRIIPGFMAQGGDFTDGDGTGGKSIYGKTFQDENFSRKHEARGALSMANSGPNTNGSQFFVLFKPAPHLDRKHVVFGRLLREENQILRAIEGKGTKSGEVKGKVLVVSSGELDPPSAVQRGAARAGRSRERSRDRERSRSRRARSPSQSRRIASPSHSRSRRKRKRSSSASESRRGHSSGRRKGDKDKDAGRRSQSASRRKGRSPDRSRRRKSPSKRKSCSASRSQRKRSKSKKRLKGKSEKAEKAERAWSKSKPKEPEAERSRSRSKKKKRAAKEKATKGS